MALAVAALFLLSACVEKSQVLLVSNLEKGSLQYTNLQNAVSSVFTSSSSFAITHVGVPKSTDGEPTDFEEALRNIQDTLSTNGKPYSMVLLYGDDVTNAAAKITDGMLGSLPVVFFGVLDASEEVSSRENFTGYVNPPCIRANMELFNEFWGNIWVTTTLDDGQTDDKLRELAKKQMEGMPYQYSLDFDLTDPSHLVDVKDRDTTKLTLIPLSFKDNSRNWTDRAAGEGFEIADMMQCENQDCGYLELKGDMWADMAFEHGLGLYLTTIPDHFGVPDEDILNNCLGGYLSPFPVMLKDVRRTMWDILWKGVKPSEIEISEHEAGYWFNWMLFKRFNNKEFRFASDLPEVSGGWHVLNIELRDRNRFWRGLVDYGLPTLSIIFLLSIIALIIILIVNREIAHMKSIVEGEDAKKHLDKVNDLIMNAGAYFWQMNPLGVSFSEQFYKDYNMTGNAKKLSVILNTLKGGSIDIVRAALSSGKDGTLEYDAMYDNMGDNIPHYFHVHANRLTREDGRKDVFGIVINMDATKKAEEERKQAFRRDEQSQLKSALLASMGHEIRTPLNAIVGFSRILVDLGDELEAEELESYKEIITSNTKQLLDLVNGVINLSEEQEKDFKITLSRKNVSMLMEEIYITHSVIVPKNLTFNFVKGADDDYIMVNRSSLMQVLSNLMNNAVKFTKEGSITLGWETQKGKIVIFVEDTGCGIAKENIDKIFTKYIKESSSSRGAGIGLALCKSLAGKMDSEIRVKSELGKGSRFEMVFKKL